MAEILSMQQKKTHTVRSIKPTKKKYLNIIDANKFIQKEVIVKKVQH